GGFKCHHSHGHLFHIGELKEFLGINEEPTEAGQPCKPQKLPPALRPVLKLDPKDLPDVMRDAVIDLADRLQCPPDYLAVAMLSAAGAVVGNKVGIFPYANDESWEVYPALWGGIVGDPGTKKTPSLLHAHKPLQHLESQAAQKYASDMQAYKQAMLQHDKAVAAWSKNKGTSFKPTPPVEPKRIRYVVHDSTYQALGVILADNPRGVLALADELSGLLQSLDTAGQEAARGFYLTGWSGTGGYSFDRVGRGSIALDRYCLSVFGGFQPDRVKAYVQFTQRGSSKNDGLLQRFQLLVWPDSVGTFKFVDRPQNKSAISKYQTAVISLPTLTDQPIQGGRRLANGSQLLHFTPTAQKDFNTWYVENETMLATGGLDSARQSHFAKYRSLVPALALLFHLLDGHSGPVCDDCLTRALSFSAYLKSHADRIYASVSGHDHSAVRILAERLLDGQLADGFTCRTLTLKGWSGLATREQAQPAIDALVEYGWLTETEIRTGGRPSVKYALSPEATVDLL
ncbi:MAG: YfjI family protein, partial [Betaproteobacteria bacterium]